MISQFLHSKSDKTGLSSLPLLLALAMEAMAEAVLANRSTEQTDLVDSNFFSHQTIENLNSWFSYFVWDTKRPLIKRQHYSSSSGKFFLAGLSSYHVSMSSSKHSKLVTVIVRAFSRHFYPKRLTSVNTHIDTPTAESTMQGDSQLVRSS